MEPHAALPALADVTEDDLPLAGGKAVALGTLSRMDGIEVPPGFCVPTTAFAALLAALPAVADRIADLTADPDQAAAVRDAIEGAPVPPDLADAITAALAAHPDTTRWAVRSSATAEDLPGASFAGQHDTFLDVPTEQVAHHVGRCWASLFTDRAVAYRTRQGIAHAAVHMAVVVQAQLDPAAAGVMFTADPVTGHRRTTVIEAVPGLGDALVDGQVDPDRITLVDGHVTGRTGTLLGDDQATDLAAIGALVATRLGRPQDIEWCLADGRFQLLQARPITTLFPVPANPQGGNRVYISVGHNQMMTDPIRTLGLSVWETTSPAPMVHAGSRLFVDATMGLANPATRDHLLTTFHRGDPLTGQAIQAIVDRDGFLPSVPATTPPLGPPPTAPDPIPTDRAIVADLIARTQADIDALAVQIADVTGADVVRFVVADIGRLTQALHEPVSRQATMAGMEATWWLNDHLGEWLGEANPADVLSLGAPDNVSTEMGYALLDVADIIRPHPQVIAALRAGDDTFLHDLPGLPGGPQAHDALTGFLDTYGMRCAAEIDITRPRWAEAPTLLLPALLSAVDHAEHGAAAARREDLRRRAAAARRDILDRLAALPDGAEKVAETAVQIDRLRTFIGYREHPKYGIVSRYFIYKQALHRLARQLVADRVIAAIDDIHHLTLEEIEAAATTGQVDARLIVQRRAAYAADHALRPPRVLTSDGEAVSGTYDRGDLPDSTLVGLPVSGGTVTGRARVVTHLEEAQLEPGDILVTTHTDPSWTPAFVTIVGLVTEVGGQMTHGAVVAREYGLPAVVAVPDATRRIADGQRIRIDGTHGHVELLDPDPHQEL